MARKITFLHTADLHIGAPMRGFRNLSDSWASRLRRAIPEAYDRMIETAIARKVDFAVFAGDMFDTARASYGDYLRFFEGLERLDAAGIPSYLITGNHDPYTAWQYDLAKLPESAHMLGFDGPQFALYEREGEPLCLIGARGYHNQAWPVDEPIAAGITRNAAAQELRRIQPSAANAPFAIGVIHTGLDLDQSKAYSDPQVLLGVDIDYWACGHLHRKLVMPHEHDPRIVFPGCIQGRDLRESGERGCYFVTLEESSSARAFVSLEFLPTASVVFHSLKVDISTCKTLADIVHFVQARLFHESAQASCDEMVVRVELTGTTSLHEYLAKPTVREDLRRQLSNAYPTFFCDDVIDCTLPPRDRNALMDGNLFSGQVLRVSDRQRASERDLVDYVQSEFVKRGIDVPSSIGDGMGECNRAAETLVLDLLEAERE